VAPFSGSVSIRDLTLILGNHIERAQHLQLHLSYLDFLNIYIGGLEYGLNNIRQAKITAFNPSYVNRVGLEEIKLDELTVLYHGNALDGLTSAVNGTAFSSAQSIEANSSGMIIQLPQTTLSKVQAKQFKYLGSVSAGKQNFWTQGNHQFKMDSLTWTPSEDFQTTYHFFIKGFGYESDGIPFQSAQLQTKPTQNGLLQIESAVNSDLALFSSSGFVKLQNRLGSSELQDMEISVTKYSDTFQNVLQNIERLLSISLPKTEDGITIQLKGTLSNPSISP
jgi:hypothetical protein